MLRRTPNSELSTLDGALLAPQDLLCSHRFHGRARSWRGQMNDGKPVVR